MQCPHCFSLMENYRSDRNDRSRVEFYRCTLCHKEHVSCEQITVRQLHGRFEDQRSISPTPSHISSLP